MLTYDQINAITEHCSKANINRNKIDGTKSEHYTLVVSYKQHNKDTL